MMMMAGKDTCASTKESLGKVNRHEMLLGRKRQVLYIPTAQQTKQPSLLYNIVVIVDYRKI